MQLWILSQGWQEELRARLTHRLLLFLVLLLFAACGGTSKIQSFGYSTVQNGVITVIPGGIKTRYSIVTGSVVVTGTQTFPLTFPLHVGDLVVVDAVGVSVFAERLPRYGAAFSALGYLNALPLFIDFQNIGSLTNETYEVFRAGSLFLSFEWVGTQIYDPSEMKFTLNFGQGGVFVDRCSNPSGQTIPCP